MKISTCGSKRDFCSFLSDLRRLTEEIEFCAVGIHHNEYVMRETSSLSSLSMSMKRFNQVARTLLNTNAIE